MTQKSLAVLSMHKTATVLQEKIFKYVADSIGIKYYKYFDVQQKKHSINHPCIITDRFIQKKDLNVFDVILIIRHPINRLISEYYSFGWTHPDNLDWIFDIDQRKIQLEKFKKIRYKIRISSLDDYVINNLNTRRQQYEEALSYKECLLIPYEFMMGSPIKFFDIISKKLGRQELSQDLYENFKEEFIFLKDFSEDIVNEKSNSHKRVLNHFEYMEKLQEETIKLIHNEIGNLLNEYNCLCKSYGLYYYDFNY